MECPHVRARFMLTNAYPSYYDSLALVWRNLRGHLQGERVADQGVNGYFHALEGSRMLDWST